MSEYKGKVLLIVNVASYCGYTSSNYKELQQLYDKYHDKGLEILAFPCNQFGSQEPNSLAKIKTFAKKKGATFPLMAKVFVNGNRALPLFKWLKKNANGARIEWNFGKFLVSANGEQVQYFDSDASPINDIQVHVKHLLMQKQSNKIDDTHVDL